MLELHQVTKEFRSGADHVVAIRNVSLRLERGDVLTVIGSNGAGKSTLLNLVAGLFLPTSGAIRIHDRDVTAVPAYQRARWMGRIVQDPLAGTAPSMTVAENLALASRRGARSLRFALPRRLRAEYCERLETLGIGLENRLDCRASLLSGGERQALTVLMATLARPEILLLDEHTAALDPRNAAMIVELTCEFVERLGLTTIMVTHNMEQAIDVGNRLIMMHKGEIIHELEGRRKQRVGVADLVSLFTHHHVTDDELLLEAAY